ncbi:methyltransferase-like protein 27 isoform 1-T1 [Megaptera novaeangliae]
MALEEGRSLPEVRARVAASHGITDLAHKLHFYDQWAPDYDQDVAGLQYRAPRLAVDCLTQALPGPPHAALILDVACGTGLVAAELQARGFLQLHGVDGSPGMLEQARARGLYQHLSLCTLGQEPLPSSEGTYDAVLTVGALSDGHVPCSAVPELLRVTKPGEKQPIQPHTGTFPSPHPQTQASESLRPSESRVMPRVTQPSIAVTAAGTGSASAATINGPRQTGRAGRLPACLLSTGKPETTPLSSPASISSSISRVAQSLPHRIAVRIGSSSVCKACVSVLAHSRGSV